MPPQTNQPNEAGILKLDIHKAINRLGWKPKWNTTQAIHQTLQWYKSAIADDPFEYTDKQVSIYQDQ